MNEHEKINYVEFPTCDMRATRNFFVDAFGWQFQDFGPDYMAFSRQGIEGGFFRANLRSCTQNGAALLVLYSQNLEATKASIEKAGGRIVKDVFDFPGGRRFHFSEPSGNELAVWSDC
ncbi:MAG: VOC family protein [Saccharospirillaceae bacterium]|nr:glyoxalase [Thalassolituus sp. HI0120]MCH2042296.1 VOC family protein [Saccharospirillaceae bacterium]